MKDNIKNIVVTVVFSVFLISMFLINTVKGEDEISKSERRKLSKFPEFSLNNILSGEFMSSFEDAALDQFVGRDSFRRFKAQVLFNIFNQKDNNKIYIEENHAVKYDNLLKEPEVKMVATKINKLQNKMLKDMNVYYSVIPDKNYFLADKYGYPKMDYSKMLNILDKNINDAKYIDLFNTLTIDDYYSTDTHWKQENLDKVIKELSNEMKFPYEEIKNMEEKYPFYGVYYGQSALPLDADKLKYGYNDSIKNAKVKYLNETTVNLEDGKIYDLEKLNGNDPYDVFLSGAKSLITIENPQSKSDKELILFRDSYGSSLTPLLIDGYKKITIIDLRYIASPLLEQFVEFNDNSDVLFIYCTDVINNGSILKVF